MRSKLLVVGMTVLSLSLLVVATGLQSYQGGEQRQVLLPDNVTFELNTSLSGNFTISVYDDSDGLAIDNATMELVNNASYDLYQFNYSINTSELAGDGIAKAWRITNDSAYVLGSQELHVATDQPRIFELTSEPVFKLENDTITVFANVSDAADDLQRVDLTINGTTYGMSQQASYPAFTSYSTDFTINESGSYQYEIAAEDDGGLIDTVTDVLHVFSGARTEQTRINISVDPSCRPMVEAFDAPGGETAIGLDLLAVNTSGTVFSDFKNEGAFAVNLSVKLNVTDEENAWQPGEPMGPGVTNYTYHNITLPADVENETINDTVMEEFTSENQTGFFTARGDVNYTCYNGSETLGNGTLTPYENFYVGKAGAGGPGGEEETFGPGGDNATFTLGGNQTNSSLTFNGTHVALASNGSSVTIALNGSNLSLGGNLSELTSGGDEEALGPGGDDETFGPGGDRERFGPGGQESRFGPNGTRRRFGPGGNRTAAQPIISVVMEPLNRTYEALRRQYGQVRIRVENAGPVPITDLSIRPRTGFIEGNVSVQPAQIANLTRNESLNTSVFVRPGADVRPGVYSIPLVARGGPNDIHLATQYVFFRVRQGIFQSQIAIEEVSRSIEVVRNGSTTIPVLLRNTGKTDLENVTAELRNIEGVGSAAVTRIENLTINGTQALRIHINASNQLTSTNATLVVSTASGAYSFANIGITVTPEQGLIPPQFRLPLVATVWTILLVLYALMTRFYNLESPLVKIPFIMLILGEVTIMLYVATQYYGLSSPLLPF